MASDLPALNVELIQGICGYIKGGAFEQTACEVMGVPHEVFQEWLAQAQRKNAGSIFRMLLQHVRQARAQARLQPEMKMRETSMRHWLLNGPGRDAPGLPGWAAAAKGSGAATALEEQFSEKLYEMVVAIQQALKPFPDALVALEPVVARYFSDVKNENSTK